MPDVDRLLGELIEQARRPPTPEESERARAEFHELAHRYDTDPAERARIASLAAELDGDTGDTP